MKTNKKKLVDKTCIVTTVFCLLSILLGVAVYNRLPDQVAIHWGIDNQPNGWMPKWAAVFILPVFLAVLNLICHIGTNSDSKREAQSQRLLALVKWMPAALCMILYPVTLFIAMGAEISVESVVGCVIGVLFVVIGNYMPKCRQNYTLGIKLPWTLADEENWNKTHQMAGPLYMIAGLIFLVCGFFGWAVPVIIVLIAAAVTPVVYSFVLFRRKS